jgi:hypothetical protein
VKPDTPMIIFSSIFYMIDYLRDAKYLTINLSQKSPFKKSNTMTTTNPETGETIGGRSPRFSHWCAFLVFSTISMAASVEEVRV